MGGNNRMELFFFRHAQGQHVMKPPKSLQMTDPHLTEVGVWQAKKMFETYPISLNDLIIMSPLRRTIQTALVWTRDVNCRRIIHPLVGPRMFPLLSEDKSYGCDQPLPKEIIKEEFPELEIEDVKQINWKKGINSISNEDFSELAQKFIDWCKGLNTEKVYIVSHDGTITSYRQYLGENVTREHFLDDTDCHKAII
jgi:broad specificity phosphatase PhoE